MSNQVCGKTVKDGEDFKEDFRGYILKNEEDFNSLGEEINLLEQNLAKKEDKIRVSSGQSFHL